MPTLHYNGHEVPFRGRPRKKVRRILYVAERHGVTAACDELDVPYTTVWRLCNRAGVDATRSYRRQNPREENEEVSQ